MNALRFTAMNAGWSILNPSHAYAAIKAMREYRKKNPLCEMTGSDRSVQVHHIIPVWAAPELAADKNNMISLSASSNIHLIFGHNGNYRMKYIKNIKEIAEKIKKLSEEKEVVQRII